jgi:quercetin dioxygenase-like cupin family protein
METRVIRGRDVETQTKPWGTIKWNVGGPGFRDVGLTCGIVTIRPGAANPIHAHPNCDEILQVMEGSVEHTLPEGGTVRLEAGDTIVISRGKSHQARNIGQKEAVLAVAFNSWDRQVENE